MTTTSLFGPGNKPANARDEAATIEDLEFLAEHRTGTHEAAQRAGFPSTDALERWLRVHERPDLYARLRDHDVTIPNYVAFDRTIFYTRRRCTS